MGWLRDQWTAFRASYVVDEALLKTSPGSLVAVLVISMVFTLVPAYVPQLAAVTKFRHAWAPVVVAFVATCLSYGFHAVKGRGPWAPVFLLLDTAFYTTSVALASALTAPPTSHAYAVVLGLMLAAGQSRDYSLTLPFALSVCVPSIGIVLFFDRGPVDLLIVSFACALALWLSHQTGLQRRLARQNEGLKTALLTSEQVTNESMDIALSNTLIGVGQFLHELRNLQSTVYHNLQYLTEAHPSEAERSEALEDSLRSQVRIKTLIDRTIEELRQKGKVRNEEFDVAEALRDGFSDAAGSTRCEVAIPDRRFNVVADPAQLREVIETLVTNAAQAGAGLVRVRSFVDPSNRSVTLEVADDGPGLSPQALGTLFQPFGTHGKKSGTGLGLYLAKRRVELMGGGMRAENQSKGGAVFTVSIPGSIPPSKAGDHVEPPQDGAHADP